MFELIIEADDSERQDVLKFSWVASEFSTEMCILQLNFENPLFVSDELGIDDQLKLRVIDPSLLLSSETKLNV